ncbi:MAG: hypothetical protein Q9223_003298 [Gallowayella weberi]
MAYIDSVAYEPDLDISLPLEEDPTVEGELFSFRRKENEEPDKKYRPSEQQLLQEGKLGGSELIARIKKATSGMFNGQPACLVLIRVDLCPKRGGRGWFRFRNATIEIDFSDIDRASDPETFR